MSHLLARVTSGHWRSRGLESDACTRLGCVRGSWVFALLGAKHMTFKATLQQYVVAGSLKIQLTVLPWVLVWSRLSTTFWLWPAAPFDTNCTGKKGQHLNTASSRLPTQPSAPGNCAEHIPSISKGTRGACVHQSVCGQVLEGVLYP